MKQDIPDRVAVTVDVSVPRRFTMSAGSIAADIEFDSDGRPLVHELKFTPPVSVADLQQYDWAVTVDVLVHFKAFDELRVSSDLVPFDKRVIHLTRSLSRSVQRRPGLTDEQLDDIAAAYREGGAQQVAEKFHVGYRQASRYVAKARTAGLL